MCLVNTKFMISNQYARSFYIYIVLPSRLTPRLQVRAAEAAEHGGLQREHGGRGEEDGVPGGEVGPGPRQQEANSGRDDDTCSRYVKVKVLIIFR